MYGHAAHHTYQIIDQYSLIASYIIVGFHLLMAALEVRFIGKLHEQHELDL